MNYDELAKKGVNKIEDVEDAQDEAVYAHDRRLKNISDKI
jgi:hypothetical protein